MSREANYCNRERSS